MAYTNTNEDRRKTERLPTAMAVEVEVDGHMIDGTLTEIGGGGAKIQFKDARLDAYEGRNVKLHIPKFGDFDGHVVWQVGNLLGIVFHENHKTLVSLIREASALGIV